MANSTINVSDVTRAILGMLRAAPALQQVNVSRSLEVNESPIECPWMGLYRRGVRFPPRTLGQGTGFRNHEIDFVLVIQASGGESGEDCELALEQLVADTMAIFLTDQSLAGTVDVLGDMSIQYQDYSRVEDVYMQTAALYFTAITRVLAS